MAIRLLPSGNYQARFKGPDGKVISAVFSLRLEAVQQVFKWKDLKKRNAIEVSSSRCMTINQFFEEWFGVISSETAKEFQSGWRERQYQYYRDYMGPVIGTIRLRDITPAHIKRVFVSMAKMGRSPQTQRLVYSTMRKMFGDAVETYQYTTFNPVVRKLKPAIHVEEAVHLSLDQSKRLLTHVQGRKYELAIWLQLYMGLRVGELVALKWDDINLESGRITIHRTFVRKTGVFRDFPKGGKHHSHSIPKELLEKLQIARGARKCDWVVTSTRGNHPLPYRWYMKALKKYCTELALPNLGTHGLRHSTSELYLHHGATLDDLKNLFDHSSVQVTERYVHDRGTNLERVTGAVQLFGGATNAP